MRQAIYRLAVVCAIWGVTLSATARDVYVAREGMMQTRNQRNPGEHSKAVDAIRGPGRRRSGSTGQYYLERPDARPSTPGRPSSRSSCGNRGRRVRLTGGGPWASSARSRPTRRSRRVSAEAKRHVLVADLATRAFRWQRQTSITTTAREVIFGDRPMQSARWPNDGFAEFDKVIDSGVTHWVSTVYRPGTQFPAIGRLWISTAGSGCTFLVL